MSDVDNDVIEYAYDEEAAIKADDAASRLTEGGGYVGHFTKVSAIVSAQKGTHGMEFEFEAPGSGTAKFTLYTKNAEGNKLFGANFVNAMMFMFGLRALRSVVGRVEVYDEEAKARIEVDGKVFPELCGKPIGLVLQKELSTDTKHIDREKLVLAGVYQPETKLMLSEIKERKTAAQGVKLARLLKTVAKPKDQRKKSVEPAQPAMGAAFGGDAEF